MLFRNTMILVLVVWLLVGWVRSYQDETAQDDRDRRVHFKKRILDRLSRRGYEMRERERVAEELLARLETHFTSTSVPPSRHQRDHHRSLQRQSSPMLQDDPYPEIASYAQVLQPGMEEEEEEELEELEELREEEEELSEMEEAADIIRNYMSSKIFQDRTMERRHVAEVVPEVVPEETRRLSREERRRMKEEKKRRREEKKKKRANKKNKRKRNRDFEQFLRNQSIPIHESEGEKYVDCCPSKLIVVEKTVGKAPNTNLAMEIIDTHRYFYERVCWDGIEGKECVFPTRSLKKGVVTRCFQQYSYTQALVRRYQSEGNFSLGYIQTKSGCSCQVSLTHKKKKKRKR